MHPKQISKVINPPPPHMVGDGFRVHNIIPTGIGGGFGGMDPFLLLDYNARMSFAPRDQPRGVGVHPHRGFETVTIAYHGRIAHHDSFGNSGIVREGGVQWMTAASGLLHKEYHEAEFSRTGGDFQMVQLWVNLPAAHKMSAPRYQGFDHEQIPQVPLADGAGHVEIIAGTFRGTKGAASTFSPIHLYTLRLGKDHSASFSFPETYHTGLLVIEGTVSIGAQAGIRTDQFVHFGQVGTDFQVKADTDAVALILSGEPIGEPIAAYGPFVMNTREEIMQAMEDVNQGKFGTLEE